MSVVPFSHFEEGQSLYLLEMQKSYSPSQREMAIGSQNLVWVRPRNRTLPKALRESVWRESDGHCVYCDCELSPSNFTVDHIQSVAEGGTNDPENLTIACRSCNSSKGALALEEWRR